MCHMWARNLTQLSHWIPSDIFPCCHGISYCTSEQTDCNYQQLLWSNNASRFLWNLQLSVTVNYTLHFEWFLILANNLKKKTLLGVKTNRHYSPSVDELFVFVCELWKHTWFVLTLLAVQAVLNNHKVGRWRQMSITASSKFTFQQQNKTKYFIFSVESVIFINMCWCWIWYLQYVSRKNKTNAVWRHLSFFLVCTVFRAT